MKRLYIWLWVFVCLLFVGVTALNIYLSLRTQQNTTDQIERYISEYRKEDLQVTNALIHSAVSTINLVPGTPGKDGSDGVAVHGRDGKDGESIVGPKGDKGERGDPGNPGREIELTRDGENLFWRYVGDDFWTEL